MIYKNKKTGNVIEISCELHGEDWEAVESAPKTPARKKAVKKDETVCDSK